MYKNLILLGCLSSCLISGMENEYFQVQIRSEIVVRPSYRPAYSIYPILITNKTRNVPIGFRSFDRPVKAVTSDAEAKHIALVRLDDDQICRIDLRNGKELED